MLALLVKYKIAVIAVALLSALGLGGAGVAAANGALPLPGLTRQAAASSTATAARHGLAREIVHGTVILSDNGSWVTYTLDVGSVTSASSSAITLKRADGGSVTLTVSSSTLWGAKGKTPKDFSKLNGRTVAVLSLNGAAVHVGGRGMFKGFAYADLTVFHNGKTREIQIERGTVQSISATQISLTRADGVAYTGTLAAKVRYHQQGAQGPAQASAVKTGETVALLVYNDKVVAVRIAQP